jgi:hypothetical protein
MTAASRASGAGVMGGWCAIGVKRSMWRAGILMIGVFLVPGAIQSAWAQEAGGAGEVDAVSYREVPDRLALSVTLFDDSTLDLRIRDEMVAALERAKHSVGAESPFELELTSQMHAGSAGGTDPNLGSVSSDNDDTRIEMNIWSSSQDSILGGRHTGAGGRAVGHFEISAALRERSLGEVVWQGRAIVAAERDQVEPYVAPMVESLVESLGHTVRNGSFPVR